jgi:hypothetical protein
LARFTSKSGPSPRLPKQPHDTSVRRAPFSPPSGPRRARSGRTKQHPLRVWNSLNRIDEPPDETCEKTSFDEPRPSGSGQETSFCAWLDRFLTGAARREKAFSHTFSENDRF